MGDSAAKRQEQEYECRMTCPRCGQYGDGCNCDAATKLGRHPLDVIEDLVDACEQAFAGPDMADFPDEEDVSSPGSGITFGMIRRARAAVEALS